ncbi:MAG TPA: ATP-binding protein [Chitinophagaceae bacterium]
MNKQHNVITLSSVFDHWYMDIKNFYVYHFQKMPCVTTVDKIHTDKVLKHIKTEYAEAVTGIYQRSDYNRKKKKCLYSTTIIVLRDNCMVELEDDYCQILHTIDDYDMACKLAGEASRYKRREKKVEFEINLISRNDGYLNLKPMEIKKTKLDLKLYYEDDFIETDKIIQSRLSKHDDKGIVLLHGLPGTGKTTYLRYLVGRLKKRVLFLSPSIAGSIMNPEFMNVLINNPNSVLIIEDAENIIMDRKIDGNSAVSNLLNISDGLLADFLNVQLICTFNSPVTMVDQALLRKGRLIAKYEFGKLSIEKSQKLSKHFGFTENITKQMTIAEIANQGEKEFKETSVRVIGFRRAEELVN